MAAIMVIGINKVNNVCYQGHFYKQNGQRMSPTVNCINRKSKSCYIGYLWKQAEQRLLPWPLVYIKLHDDSYNG